MASRNSTDTADTTAPTGDGAAVAPIEVERVDGKYAVTVAGIPDGPVTFGRPGVESLDFEVAGGTISTTKERAAWLVQYAAAEPVTADTKES